MTAPSIAGAARAAETPAAAEAAGLVAVVIAAGESKRMGEFKPLLKFEGEAIIERLIGSATEAGVKNVVVVTGHKSAELEKFLAKKKNAFGEANIVTAHNPDYKQGMFSSIKTGLSKFIAPRLSRLRNASTLAGGSGDSIDVARVAPRLSTGGVLLFPVDLPFVRSETIKKIIEEAKKNKDDFLTPTFLEKNGHPLYIPKKHVEEIINYHRRGGMKGAIGSSPIRRIKTEDEGTVFDLDDKDDFEEAKKVFAAAGAPTGNMAEDSTAAGGTAASYAAAGAPTGNVQEGGAAASDALLKNLPEIIAIRHGLQGQQEEPIFLGQADIPLSGIGKKQAREMASKIEKMFTTEKGDEKNGAAENGAGAIIISSDLKRCAEFLDEMKKESQVVKAAKTFYLKEFREISLGEWDGKPIAEIKKNFPREYELRGKQMLTFRPPAGENFYDLKYRVFRGLRKAAAIASEEGAKQLFMVTHFGVIRSMFSLVEGIPLGEAKVEVRHGEGVKLRVGEPS